MKNKSVFCFFIFCISNFVSAQTFQKMISGTTATVASYSVQQTTDGGYIIGGHTNTFGAGNEDIYLIKTDGNGDVIWTKTFGGINEDEAFSVNQTFDGGYLIAGYNEIYTNFLLIKTNISGDTLWTKSFGGSVGILARSAQQTTDTGYIVTGDAGGKVGLIKTDSNGNIMWSKKYGGSVSEYGTSVKQTSDGGYIVSGVTYSFGAGNEDIYLIKVSNSGNIIWSKTFGGAGQDFGFAVLQTADGGYIVCGLTNSFGAGTTIFVVKTDNNGNQAWAKTFSGNGVDWGTSIQQNSDGGYIIAGRTYSIGLGVKVYLLRTDINGDLIWSKTYGYTSGGGYNPSLQKTSDGGYIVVGGGGGSDVYLIKTDSNGNSGCNESNVSTMTTVPSVQIVTPSTIVTVGITATNTVTTVGSGGTGTVLCYVGIEESTDRNEINISVLPNPATTKATINFGKAGRYEVWVCNMLGEILFETTTSGEEMKIDVSALPKGIYFVAIRDEESRGLGMVVRKIVKL